MNLKKFLPKKKFVFSILLLLSVISLTPILKINALTTDYVVDGRYFPMRTSVSVLTEEHLQSILPDVTTYIQQKLTLYNINAWFFIYQQGVPTNTNNQSPYLPQLFIVEKSYITNMTMSEFNSPLYQIQNSRVGSSSTKSNNSYIDLSKSIEEIYSSLDTFFSTFSYNSTSASKIFYNWNRTTKIFNNFLYSTNYTANMVSSSFTDILSLYNKFYLQTNPNQTLLYSLNDYYKSLVPRPNSPEEFNEYDYINFDENKNVLLITPKSTFTEGKKLAFYANTFIKSDFYYVADEQVDLQNDLFPIPYTSVFTYNFSPSFLSLQFPLDDFVFIDYSNSTDLSSLGIFLEKEYFNYYFLDKETLLTTSVIVDNKGVSTTITVNDKLQDIIAEEEKRYDSTDYENVFDYLNNIVSTSSDFLDTFYIMFYDSLPNSLQVLHDFLIHLLFIESLRRFALI